MLTFKAMTMVDPSTNLIEIAPMLTTTSKEGASIVENNWFAQYPHPLKCVTDQGPEFAFDFQAMLQKNSIHHSASTSHNPHGNSMIERNHQAIGQVLCTIVVAHNPKSVEEGKAVIAETLATAMHACHCATQGSIGNNSAGALAFHHDMFLDIPLVADILTLQQHQQALVDKQLLHANATRIKHDYAIGDLVYKHSYLGLSDKLKPTGTGPYVISRVHTNGTVTIQLSNTIFERINIRRIYPKFPLVRPVL